MNEMTYESMKEMIEENKKNLLGILDEREKFLLEAYLLLQGDISAVAKKAGISAMPTSRILKRVYYKGVLLNKQ